MKFSPIFAVKNIHTAVTFYQNLFSLEVVEDYGRCKIFDCGLGLQQDFDLLNGIPTESMKYQENNCELFFEEEDLDGFIQKLKSYPNIQLSRDVTEYEWGQRGIRFYDLDGHLVEVGESMKIVVQRFLDQGKTMEEIAAIMEVSVPAVQKMLE